MTYHILVAKKAIDRPRPNSRNLIAKFDCHFDTAKNCFSHQTSQLAKHVIGHLEYKFSFLNKKYLLYLVIKCHVTFEKLSYILTSELYIQPENTLKFDCLIAPIFRIEKLYGHVTCCVYTRKFIGRLWKNLFKFQIIQ